MSKTESLERLDEVANVTGKIKVKKMLLEIKEIVDNQHNDLIKNTIDYNTDLIIIISNISKAVEKELQEFF